MAEASIAASLTALTELVKAQQQQLALLQNNQNNQARQIPLISKLTKAEDLNAWREKLTRMLERYDLDKFITNDKTPEPEDPAERRKWLNECLDVDDYIQATVPDLGTWNGIRGLGWKSQDKDPKKTFDFVVQYFERGSVDSFVNLNRELITINPEKFDSLVSFQTRVNFLKERLQASEFKMDDKAYTWVVMKAIAPHYPDLYARCLARMQADALSWTDLMAELQALAVSQAYEPTLTSITSGNKPDNQILVQCKDCDRMVPPGRRHCKDCGRHPGGLVCWSCEPEKAPDTWKYKETYMEKKRARDTTTTSTTGPLRQQSGNASLNRSAFFTTNYDNWISM